MKGIPYEKGEQEYFLLQSQIAYYDDRHKDALMMLDSLGKVLSPDLDTPQLARFYSLRALVNLYLGFHELAIEMNLKALAVYENLSDYTGISNCYNAIGKAYLNQGEYERAERYFNLALDTNHKAVEKDVLGIVLINKGNVKIVQDSLDIARKLFTEAYDLFLETGDLRRIALSLYNMAKVQSLGGEYRDAIVKLDESLNIYSNLDEKYGQAMVINQKSIVYLQSGDYQQAIQMGNEAYTLSMQINNQPLVTEALLQLSKAYKAIGDFSEALDLFETYHANKTELESKNNAKRISEIEFQAQLSANEKDIQLLMQRNKAKTSQIYILIVFFGMIFLFTIGFTRFLRLKNKNLQQKQEILEKKNHLIDLENKMFENDKKMLTNDLELKNKELASRYN